MKRAFINILITLETIICFSYPVFLLVISFMFINVPFGKLLKGEQLLEVLITYVAMLGGVLGFLAIISLYQRVVGIRLFTLPAKITLLFLLYGVVSICIVVMASESQKLMHLILFGIPPIICTLHLIYLQRRFLINALTSAGSATQKA